MEFVLATVIGGVIGGLIGVFVMRRYLFGH